jgi:hypothetical protein
MQWLFPLEAPHPSIDARNKKNPVVIKRMNIKTFTSINFRKLF